MNNKNLRKCCVDYKEYSFCPRCPEDMGKPSFYFSFCSENCRDIYKTLTDYSDKNITSADANKQLENLDLSKVDNFGESYKNTISKIRAELSKSDVAVKEDIETVSVEDTVENEPSVEWVQPVPEVENADETDEIKVTEENINKGKNYRKSKNKIYSDVE